MKKSQKTSDNTNNIKNKFIRFWPYYLLQSALAAVVFLIISLLIGDPSKMVVISSMGATSFIIFVLPNAVSAQTRNIIGGHFVGMLCGAVFYLFIPAPYWLEYPLVVGISIFLMVTLDFEHPPAVGTALAVVFNEINPQIFAIIMVSAIVLSQVRFYSRRFLKDLV